MNKPGKGDLKRNQTETENSVSNKYSNNKTQAVTSGCFVCLIILSVVLAIIILLIIIPGSADTLSPLFTRFMSSRILSTDAGRWFIGVLVTTIIALVTIASSIEVKRKEDNGFNSIKKSDLESSDTNDQSSSTERKQYLFVLGNAIFGKLKRLSLKRKWILFVGLGMISLVVLLLIFSPKLVASIKIDKATAIITLTAYDDITLENFNKEKVIIAERLQLLAGTKKCDIQFKDEEIIASMPIDVFDGMNVKSCIEKYISKPLRLYTIIDLHGDYSEIKREMISKIEVVNADSCAVNWVYAGWDDVELAPTQPVLKFTLTHEGAFLVNSLLDHANAIDHPFTFSMDTELYKDEVGFYDRFGSNQYGSILYCFDWFASDENRIVFYCTSSTLTNADVYQSLAYSFRHKPLNDAFSVSVYYSPEANWEEVEKVSEKGKYQYNNDDVSGDTILMRLSMYAADKAWLEEIDHKPEIDDTTEMDQENFISKMKSRMDLIESAYSLGYSFDNSRDVMIKTTLEHIGPNILNLLTTSRLYLTSWVALKYDILTCDFKSISIEQDKSGYYYLLVNLSDDFMAKLRRYYQDLLDTREDPGDEIYLRTDDGVICTCDFSDVIKSGVIIFDKLPYITGREKITEPYLFVLKLIQEIANEKQKYLNIDLVEFSGNSVVPTTSTVNFGIPYFCEYYQHISEVLTRINPMAEMYLEPGKTDELIIHLNKKVKSGFIADGFNEVKQIYTECNLNSSPYSKVVFHILDEEGYSGIQLIFGENSEWRTFYGICSGEISDSYYEELKSVIRGSDFSYGAGFSILDFEEVEVPPKV